MEYEDFRKDMSKKVVSLAKNMSEERQEEMLDAMGPIVYELIEDLKPHVLEIQKRVGVLLMSAKTSDERAVALSAVMSAYTAFFPKMLVVMVADEKQKESERLLADYLAGILSATLEVRKDVLGQLKNMDREEVKIHAKEGEKIIKNHMAEKRVKDTSYIG